jgi:23S rRNA pseudouridine1911/1915/1917 synthase
MSELCVTVPVTLDGVRVDRAVALLADRSRSSVDGLMVAGRVRVDGETVRTRSRPLRTGEELSVSLDEPADRTAEPDSSVVFTVVHADPAIVVVDKPAGLVVHPGAGHRHGTLVNGLVARYPEIADLARIPGTGADRPGIVHRLDRGTSGLLVVARTPDAYRSLVAQMGGRTATRRYRSLVAGLVGGDDGVIEAPIARSVQVPTRMAVARRGKEARTRYHVVHRFNHPGPCTLIEATLDTGRTHQIRVHLAAIGHPVVGDETYGGNRNAPTPVPRPFLHAFSLEFDHPETGDRVSWQSPLPTDLAAVLERLSGE